MIPTLPDVLNFALRWTGDTDLNLIVISPATPGSMRPRTVYPLAGYNNLPNGATIPPSIIAAGRVAESRSLPFPANAPRGYFVGQELMTGPITPATLNVYRNGQPVNIRTVPGPSPKPTSTPSRYDPQFGATGQEIGVVDIDPLASRRLNRAAHKMSPAPKNGKPSRSKDLHRFSDSLTDVEHIDLPQFPSICRVKKLLSAL